jgi:hypothetical protein
MTVDENVTEFVEDPFTGQQVPACPKCEGLMDSVVWFGGLDGRCGWRRGPSGEQRCPGLGANGKVAEPLLEHMHRDCSTCGYPTWERPRDYRDPIDDHACGPECLFHTDSDAGADRSPSHVRP